MRLLFRREGGAPSKGCSVVVGLGITLDTGTLGGMYSNGKKVTQKKQKEGRASKKEA